jgi:hypothetical protein
MFQQQRFSGTGESAQTSHQNLGQEKVAFLLSNKRMYPRFHPFDLRVYKT